MRKLQPGRLVIASHPAAAISMLPPLVAAFVAERPGVSVRLVSRHSDVVSQLLPTEGYDLGIAELLYTGLGLIAGVRAAQRQRAVQARRPVGPPESTGATRALPVQRRGTASPLASAPGAPASRTGHTPFTRGDRS